MKAKVAPALTEILKNRIYISRKLKIFSLSDVAENWGIADRTLYRYDSEKDRELSRTQARRITELNQSLDKSLCQICGKKLFGHKRCGDCTMLIHGKPECGCNRCIVRPDYSRLIVHITKQ